jgi:hypothetical protein
MAASSTIDFFGYFIDRAAVKTQVDKGVQAVEAGVEGEKPLLDKVSEVLFGERRLRGFLKNVAGRFAEDLSVTAPQLTSDMAADAVPNQTIRRALIDLQHINLGPLSHLFDRSLLLPGGGPFGGGTGGNRINVLELNLLKGLAKLANLGWGFLDGIDAALQKRSQQLQVYFIEYYHGRFKDRNGNVLAAPGSGIDPFHLTPQLTGQLAHVLVEFTGDAAYRVPVRKPDDGKLETYTCVKAGITSAAIEGVWLNGVVGGTDLADLVADLVQYAGRQAESAMRAQVGSLIRGGGMAGINNEAVAEALTAAIGGLVKKSSEKLAYETLTRYITDPAADQAIRANVLAVLKYLHQGGAKPAGFLA